MTMPWTDRAGRFSALRLAAFALALGPGLWLAWDAAQGALGAEPLVEAIHRSGRAAIRLLLVSLAVTPLRAVTGWGRLISVRRMLGLAAFFYALGHLALYAASLRWDIAKLASEIAARPYLTVGFAALAGLAALAATSTDAAIRRMGQNWHRLHNAVYALTPLAVLHVFQQSRIDASQATLLLGLWLLLMLWRAARKAGRTANGPGGLAVLAVVATLLTATLEAAWYGLATGVPWRRVLDANLALGADPRPAAWVLVAGLAAATVALGRRVAAASDAKRVLAAGR